MRLAKLQKHGYFHPELVREFTLQIASDAKRMELSPLLRGPDCLRSPALLDETIYDVSKQPRDTIFCLPRSLLRPPHDFPFQISDATACPAIPHSKHTDETVTGVVLVESLNGPEEGTSRGKVAASNFSLG